MALTNNQNSNNDYSRVTVRLNSRQTDEIDCLVKKPGSEYGTLSDVIRAAVHQFLELQKEKPGVETIVMDLPKQHYDALKEDFGTDEKVGEAIVQMCDDYVKKILPESKEKIKRYSELSKA